MITGNKVLDAIKKRIGEPAPAPTPILPSRPDKLKPPLPIKAKSGTTDFAKYRQPIAVIRDNERPVKMEQLAIRLNLSFEYTRRTTLKHPDLFEPPYCVTIGGNYYFYVSKCRERFAELSGKVREQVLTPAQSNAISIPAAEAEASANPPPEGSEPELFTYGDARAMKEKFAAKEAEIDYQIKAGKLISVLEVKKAWSDIATAVQKTILSVPDRITPLLVGENDHTIIHQRISTELKYALKNLSFELKSIK